MPHPRKTPESYRRGNDGPGLIRTRSLGVGTRRPVVTARSSVGAFTRGNLGDTNTAPVRPDETRDWDSRRPYNKPAKVARKRVDPLAPREPSSALRRGRPTFTGPAYEPKQYTAA